MLQPKGKLRNAGVLERLDEEVLAEIHRIDDVLEAEEVSLSPHHLLLACTEQVGAPEVPTEVQVGFAHRVVILIAVVALETQIVYRLPSIDAAPACGRNPIDDAVVADALGDRLGKQQGASH